MIDYKKEILTNQTVIVKKMKKANLYRRMKIMLKLIDSMADLNELEMICYFTFFMNFKLELKCIKSSVVYNTPTDEIIRNACFLYNMKKI